MPSHHWLPSINFIFEVIKQVYQYLTFYFHRDFKRIPPCNQNKKEYKLKALLQIMKYMFIIIHTIIMNKNYFSDQLFSIWLHWNFPLGLLRLVPTPRVSDSIGLQWGWKGAFLTSSQVMLVLLTGDLSLRATDLDGNLVLRESQGRDASSVQWIHHIAMGVQRKKAQDRCQKMTFQPVSDSS